MNQQAFPSHFQLACNHGNGGPSPAFATRGQESLKQSVFRGVVSQGRHHRVDGHYVTGIPSVVILGGGWPGKLILSFCNRSA